MYITINVINITLFCDMCFWAFDHNQFYRKIKTYSLIKIMHTYTQITSYKTPPI